MVRQGENDVTNKEIDELRYIMSHDLQEPLRMITSYMQLLDKKYGDKIDEDAKEYIKYAVEAANRLKVMMDDLLTYSRVGYPALQIKPVDFENVTSGIKRLLKTKYKEDSYQLTFEFKDDSKINADETLMTKLFYNMVDNALKFNKNEKPVVVIRNEDNNEEHLFYVKDNGMGIEKEYHEKIFGIFQKLHHQHEYPGTGIGLAVCRKIANKHNGRIWVDSDKQDGSTFYVSIPKI